LTQSGPSHVGGSEKALRDMVQTNMLIWKRLGAQVDSDSLIDGRFSGGIILIQC
jgi:hypothetical protein